MSLYIGLMSGTSMDAIDAVLVEIEGTQVTLRGSHSQALPAELRQELITLNTPGLGHIGQLGHLDVKLGQLFANATETLLQASDTPASAITAIGSHGQTVRHRPKSDSPNALPFTLQIGDPNTLAHLTGITTVADFRRRDIAAGGEGAPLVPAFHEALLRTTKCNRVVLNIGGMANLTILPADPLQLARGFDCGPGNVLMDGWIERELGQRFDQDGRWAAGGEPIEPLLNDMLNDCYFHTAPPKSTGREQFNVEWVMLYLQRNQLENSETKAQAIQATLLHLSVESIADAIESYAPQTEELLICGGGVHNSALIRGLMTRLDTITITITSSAEFGLDPDYLEAIAFAWLAKQTLEKRPGNLPAVTGAECAVVLGGVYYSVG